MITVLTGENSFELARALRAIMDGFDGVPEKFVGSDMELTQLPDLLQGGTLFADKRLVVIENLSDNKALWEALPEWLERKSSDVYLVLVDPKPDKRTKTFKELKKHADVKEFVPWSDRDTYAAEKWAIQKFGETTSVKGLTLSREAARKLVARVGTDQWRLHHAIEKLAVLDDVTPEIVEQVVEASPTENVFNLLDAALRGDAKKVQAMVKTLQRTQDPYMTFGLLSSQVFQLATLATAAKPASEVAADIGAHPYALSKLAPHAKKLGRTGARKIVAIFADTDTAMKSSATDPWLLIEKTLYEVAA